MKIRTGFVSNSSSSSFVITDTNNFERVKQILQDNREDYYIYNNKLYTSGIYDGCYDTYRMIQDLSSDEIDCEMDGIPYDADNYIEVEGDLGIRSIYIPREGLTDKELIELGAVPYTLSCQLYLLLKNYFEGNSEFTENEILGECRNYIIYGGADED